MHCEHVKDYSFLPPTITCYRCRELRLKLRRRVLEHQGTQSFRLGHGYLPPTSQPAIEEPCLILTCELSVGAFLYLWKCLYQYLLSPCNSHLTVSSLSHFSSHHAEYYMHEAKRLKHRADAMVCHAYSDNYTL